MPKTKAVSKTLEQPVTEPSEQIVLATDQVVRGAEQYRVLEGGSYDPLEFVTVYLKHDPTQQAAFHASFIVSEDR